jgi:hypothetical protein
MDGDVDLAIEHGRVNFLGEQPLSAGLRERTILDHVARSADDDDLEPGFVASIGDREQPSELVRLGEGERRPARANPQGYFSHLS